MAHQPNLSLPNEVPEMERYHDQPENILPFALYSLFELDDQTLEDFRRRCKTGCEDDMIKLPPQPRFVGDSLRSIVDYHVQLAHDGDFDPTYFLVCVYEGSTSIMAVTLDDDDLECKPDLLWTKMDESGLLLVNLQIANTDWSEAKEEDLGDPNSPGEDDNNGPVGGDARDDDHNDESSDNNGESDDKGYGKPPPLGFHIQVYTVSDVDSETLLRKIEPMAHLKKADQSDWVCKVHRLPAAASRDPTRYAANLHPSRCAIHSTLEKKYFIVSDEPSIIEEGVAIVHIDWDGKVIGKTKEQLLEFGQSLDFEVQRAESTDTGKRAAVGTVCMLAQGYQKWHPKVKQFAIYYTNISDGDIKSAESIDPRWSKRGHGEDRVALGGSMQEDEIAKGGGFWPALIRRHVAMCRKYKFVPAFVRQYFLWCDDDSPTADSTIQLVKLDWNGDVRSVEMLAKHYDTKASLATIRASKAHKQLTEIVNGNLRWEGESIA